VRDEQETRWAHHIGVASFSLSIHHPTCLSFYFVFVRWPDIVRSSDWACLVSWSVCIPHYGVARMVPQPSRRTDALPYHCLALVAYLHIFFHFSTPVPLYFPECFLYVTEV